MTTAGDTYKATVAAAAATKATAVLSAEMTRQATVAQITAAYGSTSYIQQSHTADNVKAAALLQAEMVRQTTIQTAKDIAKAAGEPV